MIALLCYSINCLANDDSHPFTWDGDSSNDSIAIAYEDLRIVNSKLIELDYEKEINTKLKNIIHNDSILIENYININDRIKKDYTKIKRERNILFGVAGAFVLTSIILIFK